MPSDAASSKNDDSLFPLTDWGFPVPLKKAKTSFPHQREFLNSFPLTKTVEYMSTSKEHATTKSSAIRCVEVMVSKEGLEKNTGLLWTLSVYSLENQPVVKTPAHDSELFHFMVFDWERTIKKLLASHQIAYLVMRHFSPESVLSELPVGSEDSVRDRDYMAAAAAVHDTAAVHTNSMLSRLSGFPEDDLILEQEAGY